MPLIAASRRNVLKYSALTAALAVVGVGVSYTRATAMDVVVAVLHRRVGSLGMDPETYVLFAAQYVEFRRGFQEQLRALGSVDWFFRVASPYEWLAMRHPLRRMEDNIVSRFMLSTDYFEHAGGVTRAVRYLGWHDPYKRPCRRLFFD